ncbi:uncharacterized protein LOC131603468 [Vicia villosa]|uniref:uncharacterized protein LOC131603468 n=1 Tax=Vicia villosa TaxID=3911 RepID=UPI00273B67B8|nr:uncharacterized protein LOC131603468 [Vicia villosa]
MHNQDQRKTHTPGHENHGVYVCHKCGWPFPNPHPSAKHRRAHKKICGTVEGYKRKQNGSDDERVSDDDYKTPGLVLSSGNNEKGNVGIKGKFTRVESDVFSDAVADFPDTGVKDHFPQTLKGSSGNNDFNATDVTPLVANSSNEFQIKSSEIPQNESFEVENIVESQGQLSGSSVDPLISSVADSKTEELSIVHGDGFSGLSSESSLSKAAAVCDTLPEKNIYTGEDVTGSGLTHGEKESNLKGKDEVKSERDVVEIVESTNNIDGDGAVNPNEKKGSEFVSLQPQYELPLEVNSSIINKETPVESAHAIESNNSSEVKVLQEKEDVNVSSDPLPVHDDTLGVAYPHSESLKHEEDVSKESNFHFNTSQSRERSGVLSEDTHAEHCSEFSLGELATETYQRSHEIGVSMKTETSENDFSEEHGPDDVHENSQLKSSLLVSSNEYQREASFQSATDETFDIINVSHRSNDTTEINDVSVDGKVAGANVENDTEVLLNDYQPRDLLQSEVEESSVLYKNNGDDAGETGKIEECDRTEEEINSNIKLYEEYNKPTGVAVDSHVEQATHLLVETAEDFSIKHTPHSSTNTKPSAQHDSAVEDDSNGEPVQDQGIDTSADSHVATEDLTSKYTAHSSINTKFSAQHVSAVEENSGGEGSIITAAALSVQDQSVANLIKLTSPGTDASVDSSSRRESLEGNWGSSSVISMISDAPTVIEAETLPPIGSLAASEEGKSDLNTLQAAPADRQLSGKSATFELPSFTTLVEPNHAAASPEGAASEIPNPQPLSSTLPAGWFPTLNQVINDSEGRKKNEETIAKITNRSSSNKEHTPLKSLLDEVTHSSKKPKSPKVEETNNVSGLTTVNSILGPESPSAAQVAKEKAADEWNSPARYPANIKREKKKLKSRPLWLQFVCCSTAVDHPQRR